MVCVLKSQNNNKENLMKNKIDNLTTNIGLFMSHKRKHPRNF